MTQQEKQINYMGPFITMVFLFFIVGFLTTANTQFQGPLKETFLSEVGGLKNTFATLITFSWFLAYPVCGGVGSSWISKYGYKGTLMRGLLVMIVGLGLFFASSYFTVHFPEANWHAGNNVIPGGFLIFLLGSFVVGASATILIISGLDVSQPKIVCPKSASMPDRITVIITDFFITYFPIRKAACGFLPPPFPLFRQQGVQRPSGARLA